MKYHITVNDTPYCMAPIYRLGQMTGLSAREMCECSCACGYGEKKSEAEADAAKLAKAMPHAVVKVAEGECSEDPWWSTPDGRAATEAEDKLHEDPYEAPVDEVRQVMAFLREELGDAIEGCSLLEAVRLLWSQRENARNAHAATQEEAERLREALGAMLEAHKDEDDAAWCRGLHAKARAALRKTEVAP